MPAPRPPQPEPLTGLNGQDVDAIRQARDAATKARAVAKTKTRQKLRVAARGTRLTQRGHAIAIDTDPAPPGDKGPGVLLRDVVYLKTSDLTLHKTNVYTDGRDQVI